jgi:glycosyltransferase involved in cell wall biosynthesis
VVTSSRGKEAKFHREKIGVVEVIRFPEKWHLFEAPLIPRIAISTLTQQYDIVHVNGMSPTITDLAILFSKLRKKPVVLTYHNDAETGQWGRTGRLAAVLYAAFALLAVDLVNVVVCSTRSYAETSPVLRYTLDKLQIVPLGVEMPKHYPPVQTQGPRGPGHLLFVGQLKDYKGLHVLIEALSSLVKAGNDITLSVVGTGPESTRLESMTKELGLSERVVFHGNVPTDKLPEMYAGCDLLVLPSVSRREAFGLVVLEAFSAGKHVVASDIPGLNELVSRGGGTLAQPEDPASLADAILTALSRPDGAEGYRGFAESMSWDVAVEKYESMFLSLVAK